MTSVDQPSDAQHIDFCCDVKLEDALKVWKILEVVLDKSPVARYRSSLNGNPLLSKVDINSRHYRDGGR